MKADVSRKPAVCHSSCDGGWDGGGWSNHWVSIARLWCLARRADAVGMMNLVWGNAVWRVWEGEMGVVRRGGLKVGAVEPWPWRIMIVCLWSSRGWMIVGLG